MILAMMAVIHRPGERHKLGAVQHEGMPGRGAAVVSGSACGAVWTPPKGSDIVMRPQPDGYPAVVVVSGVITNRLDRANAIVFAEMLVSPISVES